MPLLQNEHPVLIVNLDTINASLKALGPAVQRAARKGMLEGAEPIRRDAENLADTDISGMKRKRNSNWALQRSGATAHEVYIVPVERGVKSKTDPRRRRPSFVGVMFGKSYNPAFEKGKPGVVATVDKWLDSVSAGFNRGSRTL